jgi:hypothetical protein
LLLPHGHRADERGGEKNDKKRIHPDSQHLFDDEMIAGERRGKGAEALYKKQAYRPELLEGFASGRPEGKREIVEKISA